MDSLVELGQLLRARNYSFTTITPASHARVIERRVEARDVRDVLGWSLPFQRGTIDADVERCLQQAGALAPQDGGRTVKATLRASTIDDKLFLHSAFPTDAPDAVFFGPDTYRYVALLDRWLPGDALGRVVDVGAGTGAGGLMLASRAREVLLADINHGALRLAEENARINGVHNAHARESNVLANVEGDIDVVIANPPYLVDASARVYRHGGARGIELALRILEESLARVARGGRVLVYTGTPVVDGKTLFVDGARAIIERRGAHIEKVEELDPDVFGEEVSTPAYADVERIALVGFLARRPS